jgi:hypothetical protein
MQHDGSIIVYRSPLEKAFWEGGYALPIIAFMIVMTVTFVVTMKLLEWIVRGRQQPWMLWVCWFVSGLAGIATLYILLP